MPTPVLDGRTMNLTFRAPPYRGPISFGLGAANDYSASQPFLNLMALSRPWYDPGSSMSSGASTAHLKAEGAFDANNFPYDPSKTVDGRMQTILAYAGRSGAAHRAGVYLMTWDGTATVAVGSSGTSGAIVEANSIEFTWNGQSNLAFTVSDFTTTDNPRNFVLTRADRREAFDNGDIFNPDYLDSLRNFNIAQIRFMDWGQTNNSFRKDWSDRTPVGAMRYRKVYRGSVRTSNIPYEYMIALANELECDPWVCVPHEATDDYIEKLCELFRDEMAPGLTLWLEYTNEHWNREFQQNRWLGELADAEWGDDGTTATQSMYGKKALNCALVARGVFTGENESRLKTVFAGQVSRIETAQNALFAPRWEANEPGNYVAPHTGCDIFAVTNYFGSQIAGRHDRTTAVLDAYTGGGLEAAYPLIEEFARDHARNRFEAWGEHRDLLDPLSIVLAAYEGGQHVHHRAQISYNQQILDGDGATTVFSFPEVGLPNDWFFVRVRKNIGSTSWQTLDEEEYDLTVVDGVVTVEYPLSGDPLGPNDRLLASERENEGTNDVFNPILESFVNSPEMADLYKYVVGMWPRFSDQAFMQFQEWSSTSPNGTWGLYQDYGMVANPSPRTLLLLDIMGAPDD